MLLFLFSSILLVGIFKYFEPQMTVRMVAASVMASVENRKYCKPVYYWVDLNDISPSLIKAVLAAEDQRFPDHCGFDFIEIKNAVKGILKSEKIRGASTISMQAARTVFLFPDRTITRKAMEAYFTILVELIWGKARILEIYLNTVDWGPGIMGAQAAALKYFKIRADEISDLQAALLAAILPGPHRLSVQSPDATVIKRSRRILKNMKNMPVINAQ